MARQPRRGFCPKTLQDLLLIGDLSAPPTASTLQCGSCPSPAATTAAWLALHVLALHVHRACAGRTFPCYRNYEGVSWEGCPWRGLLQEREAKDEVGWGALLTTHPLSCL
eukprot:scaffold19992_cov19-Tisochrysis_lutea.AAC.4